MPLCNLKPPLLSNFKGAFSWIYLGVSTSTGLPSTAMWKDYYERAGKAPSREGQYRSSGLTATSAKNIIIKIDKIWENCADCLIARIL